MFMTSIFIPSEVMHRIFLLLNDFTSLGRAQQVSKDWLNLTENNALWQNLFKKYIPSADEVHRITGKEALRNSIIRNEKDFINTVTIFLCRWQWGKKTRLECLFPSSSIPPNLRNKIVPKEEPFSNASDLTIVIEQILGCHPRRTQGFDEVHADKTQYYCFTGDMQPLFAHQNQGFSQLWLMNDAPYHPHYTAFSSQIPLPNGIGCGFFEANIQDVDVGYGNTLGYFAAINQWKEPFELFCVSAPRGRSKWKWIGRIPYNSEFKFVKIDPNRNITWENICKNRYWASTNSPLCIWEDYLEHVPLLFP